MALSTPLVADGYGVVPTVPFRIRPDINGKRRVHDPLPLEPDPSDPSTDPTLTDTVTRTVTENRTDARRSGYQSPARGRRHTQNPDEGPPGPRPWPLPWLAAEFSRRSVQ